jgi:hypothetical protein
MHLSAVVAARSAFATAMVGARHLFQIAAITSSMAADGAFVEVIFGKAD